MSSSTFDDVELKITVHLEHVMCIRCGRIEPVKAIDLAFRSTPLGEGGVREGWQANGWMMPDGWRRFDMPGVERASVCGRCLSTVEQAIAEVLRRLEAEA